MKRGKNKSDLKKYASEVQLKESFQSPPFDILVVKVLSLQVPEKQPMHFAMQVVFYDQLILDEVVTSLWARELTNEEIIAQGVMNYDPSDYEKISLFADTPLKVTIQPLTTKETNVSPVLNSKSNESQHKRLDTEFLKTTTNMSSCNVDILPMFLDTDEMYVRVRMHPETQTSVLNAISFDNLPLLTIKLSVDRNELNAKHHDILSEANYLKITLVGCYNLPIPYNKDFVYTAATKATLTNETNNNVIKFNEGYKSPKRFSDTNFYPKWETVRYYENVYSESSEKFNCKLENFQNDANIDFEKYLTESSRHNTIIWASFHRTLLLKETELRMCDFLRQYHWPLELRISGSTDYCFMASLDLFKLLYPGEDTVRLVVPLQWFDEVTMKEKCDCDPLLAFNEQAPSTTSSFRKSSKMTDSVRTSKTDTRSQMPTGSDDSCAFVIIEVALQRPFKKPVTPPQISQQEIKEMLKEMEAQPCQRECTGRGQKVKDWQNTVKMAANALRRIPFYGSADFCTFDRQLGSTRTRVEILTSLCEEAAIYVNNNFVTKDFLQSEKTFEELLMMAHACLVRIASDTLLGVDDWPKMDPIIRAARHARHFQDTHHALELYFQSVAQNTRNADRWRELATCLRDLDQDWADICLDKSLMLNPRHPLTLLSKGCMVFKKDPDAAEPFFLGILYFQPFWLVGLVAANAFYIHRENFQIADAVLDFLKKTQTQGLSEQLKIPRAWENELGDWWDSTPLRPGMSLYYDTADLLLRIRAIKLAEVCLAQALIRTGECPEYFHLLALCCRLKGNVNDALCNIQKGIEKFGEISYLRTLEAECYYTQNNSQAYSASFEKAGTGSGSYSILLSMLSRSTEHCRPVLVELLRRQPSAYAWMALAEYWITSTKEEAKNAPQWRGETPAVSNAIACAVEALKIDKQAGRAWALLARFVKPSARKLYCKQMAISCGYSWVNERAPSRPSQCHRLGKALRECRCKICNNFIL
ncbi:unnamed protein product [Parnassius mnemosyne]|uniref:Uncharacterized protein n=1 Tax=Parnassius mnemosyne TaxID=213953 RepID=A0AAV1M150_9NEOP